MKVLAEVIAYIFAFYAFIYSAGFLLFLLLRRFITPRKRT